MREQIQVLELYSSSFLSEVTGGGSGCRTRIERMRALSSPEGMAENQGRLKRTVPPCKARNFLVNHASPLCRPRISCHAALAGNSYVRLSSGKVACSSVAPPTSIGNTGRKHPVDPVNVRAVKQFISRPFGTSLRRLDVYPGFILGYFQPSLRDWIGERRHPSSPGVFSKL